jgi:hypothetical protein
MEYDSMPGNYHADKKLICEFVLRCAVSPARAFSSLVQLYAISILLTFQISSYIVQA